MRPDAKPGEQKGHFAHLIIKAELLMGERGFWQKSRNSQKNKLLTSNPIGDNLSVLIANHCLAAAGAITFKVRSKGGGIPKHFAKEKTWVKCRNPECGAEYQITKKEFFKYQEAHTDSTMMAAPLMPCRECGEESMARAVKCEKCGTVFEMYWKPFDFEDRCPKPECGYSKIEEVRKARRVK
jgi:predicted RNA-binding Zn-ribbon protein involved in translation (DUF1610 family)